MTNSEYSSNIDHIDMIKLENNSSELVDFFEDMNLDANLLDGIYKYGYYLPTTLQQRAMMPILSGSDCVIQAPTSIDKTCSYSIPILQTIDPDIKHPQALILLPTRGLAQQINVTISSLAEQMDVVSHACFGGPNIGDDLAKIESGVQVIVGTPGRIFDLISRRALHLDRIKTFVLDEIDEILSYGFIDQIHDIFHHLPNSSQTVFFATSLQADVSNLIHKFMRHPICILDKPSEPIFEGFK